LLRSTFAGSPTETLRLNSTAEEWNDEKGHRLLPFVELPPAGKHAGSLDFWFASLPHLMEPRQAGAVLPPYGLVTLALLFLGIPRVARAWRLARKAEAFTGEAAA
ncbi:MAG: hypothetical protein HY303_15595, partial [Candidatus Wallbacteria bacterium]|nr:hypothetical protein [Candidatus Wallbacteria bacterium]